MEKRKYVPPFAREVPGSSKDAGRSSAVPEPSTNENQGNRSNQRRGGGGDRAFGQKPARQLRPCGYREIEALTKKLDSREIVPGSMDLIRQVTSLAFRKRMDEIWDEKNPEWTADFLYVILKATSHAQSELKAMTHNFINEILASKLIDDIIQKHVQPLFSLPVIPESNIRLLDNFTLLLIQILGRKPDIFKKFVPNFAQLKMVSAGKIDDQASLSTSLETLSDLMATLAKEKNEMVSIMKAKERKEAEDEPPPENFRDISVCPTKEDMTLVVKPYLRKNVVHGRYLDGEHYLDVQFRLLREDFLSSLRSGVQSYRSPSYNRRRSDVYVYEHVTIGFPELDKRSGQMLCRTNFGPRPRCRWLNQMIYGTLVVLSKDGFQEDFVFGTVANRDINELQAGSVKLLFENLTVLDHSAEYKMIESTAYYEAYHHVLRGLQTFLPDEPLPFHKYLVEVNTTPQLPSYFAGCEYMVDFGVICSKSGEVDRMRKVVDVRRAHERITPQEVYLDDSQHKALIMALQQELVVIQGPPGTGKTHLGHQISRVLLANESLWNEDGKHPMLVVCATNHALDQFLNGILRFMDVDGGDEHRMKMIRVGSRCKDATLQQYMLNEVKSNYKLSAKDLLARRAQARDERTEVMKSMNILSKSLKNLEEKIIDLSRLGESRVGDTLLIDHRHMAQFKLYVVSQGGRKRELNDVFVEWLTKPHRPPKRLDLVDYVKVRMDLKLIVDLVNREIPEQLAKNLSYLCKNSFDDIVEHYKKLTHKRMFELSDNPLPEIESWPSVALVENLAAAHNISDLDAFDALMANAGNVDKAAEQIVDAIARAAAREEDEINAGIKALAEYEKELGHYFMDMDDDFEEERRVMLRGRYRREAIGVGDSDGDENDNGVGEGWTIFRRNPRKDHQDRLKGDTEKILSAVPFTEENVKKVEDIWILPVPDRWRLYKYWATTLAATCHKELRAFEKQYGHVTQNLNEINQMTDVELLKSARVLGMTTTGAASHQSVLKTIQCPIVIVEEAAEVFEAHVVTSLTANCKHVILIGDHKQLRPNPEVYELAVKYNLDISLFERLIKNNYPYVMLQNQHRMRPEIARALMPHFYEDLRDDPSVHLYEPIAGMEKNFVFINHNYPEKHDMEVKSHMNEYEGEYALCLARYLLQQGYQPDQVTILCTYMEQMLFIRMRAEAKLGLEHHVRIEVVDNYQGEESDIIILSLVRSLNPEGRIGFLSVDNRVCVAMSRAKKGLYVLGNIDFLARECDLWKRIKASLEECGCLLNSLIIVCQNHGKPQIISTWRDFDAVTKEGGCDLLCDYRLECGHTCPRLCHPTSHDDFRCMELCVRSCPNGHCCEKLCYHDCNPCLVNMDVVLDCGHSTSKPCYLEAAEVPCAMPCSKLLTCGHNCTNKCGESCTTSCEQLVSKTLSCGHLKDILCHEDPENARCFMEVKKKWAGCEHEVEVQCWMDPSAAQCPHPCGMNLPDCGHLCKGTCGKCRQGRLHVRCEEKCSRILICGHACESKCSNACPPCDKPCESACFHSRCSTVVTSAYRSQKCRKDVLSNGKRGRTCGELCPPCFEPCSNQCTHPCESRDVQKRSCEKRCMVPCEIEPCNERCSLKLGCGHPCLGLCGEDCPEICKECPEDSDLRKAYEEASSELSEPDQDPLFIQLSCGHRIESTEMDSWVLARIGQPKRNDTPAIVQLDCPRCGVAVKKSCRYQKYLNQRIIDIETIKKRLIVVDPDERRQKYATDLQKGINLGNQFAIATKNEELKSWLKTADKILKEIRKIKANQLTNELITRYGHLVALARRLSFSAIEWVRKQLKTKLLQPTHKPAVKLFFGSEDIYSALVAEWNCLLSFFDKYLIDNSASPLMYEQFQNEVVRLNRWIMVGDLLFRKNGAITEKDSAAVQEMNKLINRSQESNKETLEAFENLLTTFNDGAEVDYNERDFLEIKRCASNAASSWYKCSKGHLYAVEVSDQGKVCPECKAEIDDGNDGKAKEDGGAENDGEAENSLEEGTAI